jgi:hypothetical protein
MKLKMSLAVIAAVAAQTAVAQIAPVNVNAAIERAMDAIKAQHNQVGGCKIDSATVVGTKVTIVGKGLNDSKLDLTRDFSGDPRDNQISDVTTGKFDTVKVGSLLWTRNLGEAGRLAALSLPSVSLKFVYDSSKNANGELVDIGHYCQDNTWDQDYTAVVAQTQKAEATVVDKLKQAKAAVEKSYKEHFPGANQQ